MLHAPICHPQVITVSSCIGWKRWLLHKVMCKRQSVYLLPRSLHGNYIGKHFALSNHHNAIIPGSQMRTEAQSLQEREECKCASTVFGVSHIIKLMSIACMNMVIINYVFQLIASNMALSLENPKPSWDECPCLSIDTFVQGHTLIQQSCVAMSTWARVCGYASVCCKSSQIRSKDRTMIFTVVR